MYLSTCRSSSALVRASSSTSTSAVSTIFFSLSRQIQPAPFSVTTYRSLRCSVPHWSNYIVNQRFPISLKAQIRTASPVVERNVATMGLASNLCCSDFKNVDGYVLISSKVDINFEKEPIGIGKDGRSGYLKDIWPSNKEIAEVVQSSVLPEMFKSTYEAITQGNPFWNQLSVPSSDLYAWDPNSTYIVASIEM